VHDPRQRRRGAAAPPTAAGRYQLAAVDRHEQRDDVLPVAEPEFFAERDRLAAEVAAAALEFVAVRDGDEVAAGSEHDRRRVEQVDGSEACLPAAGVLLPAPEQQNGRQEDEDQVGAAAGMNADVGVQVTVAAQEAVGLFGEQPRQFGRVAAQQQRLAGRTIGVCGR
jgi:hypothetical protein